MRTIRKRAEPAALTQHRANRTDNYQPTYEDCPKDELRASLCAEQRGICCYCMGQIHPSEDGMKIEHRQCQERHSQSQLDYSNMHGACKGGEGSRPAAQHCDTKKGNDDISFNPANPAHRIESRLRYLHGGEILSDEPNVDDELNSVLNLNCPSLIQARKGTIDGFIAKLGTRRLTRRQIENYLSHWRGDDGAGNLQPYCQTVVYWLEKRLRRC